jgi:predicted acyltransferase (DUF342 family)
MELTKEECIEMNGYWLYNGNIKTDESFYCHFPLKISGSLKVGGFLNVSKSLKISESLNVDGGLTVGKCLEVGWWLKVGGWIEVRESLKVSRWITVGGWTEVLGSLEVRETIEANGLLKVGKWIDGFLKITTAKWVIYTNGLQIKIGCEAATIEEWEERFLQNWFVETNPATNPETYNIIKAGFEIAKIYQTQIFPTFIKKT